MKPLIDVILELHARFEMYLAIARQRQDNVINISHDDARNTYEVLNVIKKELDNEKQKELQ